MTCRQVDRTPAGFSSLLSSRPHIPTRHQHRADGCISSWLCCGAAVRSQWSGRGETAKSVGRPWNIQTGDYMEAFGRHLSAWHAGIGGHAPSGRGQVRSGALLDVGGTGNTASGMTQAVGKFAHFTRDGRLTYYVQDVDPAAARLNRSYVCDIAECPAIPSCAFDVVLSHVVLEHVKRPWDAVRTIARATRPGGLSLHVVPFSHPYERILPHYFHFTHEGLSSLFQEHGFEVLEAGYDLCVTHPKRAARQAAKRNLRSGATRGRRLAMAQRPDNRFESNWLVYIVARKPHNSSTVR